jgi:hypothetical protein
MQRITCAAATITLALTSALAAAPAFAHHSYAEFDRGKTVTITGEIQKIDWRNPHIVLTIKTKDAGTYQVFWLSSTRLRRYSGAMRENLKVGDPVSVSGSPNYDPNVHTLTLISEVKRRSDGWRWWRIGRGNGHVEIAK